MLTPNHLYLAQENLQRQAQSLIWGLVAFIAVMILFFLALRWLQKRGTGTSMLTRRMKIVDRLPVGRDTVLQLVCIGSRYILISVGREGARFVCELTDEDFDLADRKAGAETGVDAGSGGRAGFSKRFVHNLKVNTGLLPKGTPYMRPEGNEAEESPPASFDAVLREMTEKDSQQNPISDGNQRSGHRNIRPDSPSGARPLPESRAAPQTVPGVRSASSSAPRPTGGSRVSYQNEIAHLTSLSEPDRLDRKAKPPSVLDEIAAEMPAEQSAPVTAPPPPPPKPEKAELPPSFSMPTLKKERADKKNREEEPGMREDRIDALLDMIAERQSRYQKEKDTDKP